MTVTVYGIPNCDTVKKARRWFDAHGIEYVFHDFKKAGIDADTLQRWISALGWEQVLNRRGTTWRKLDAGVRDAVDESSVIPLLIEHTSLIKRPVLDVDGALQIGFDDARYRQTFGV